MKRILFLILSLLLSFGASAQKLAVESFSLAASDISAQTQPRKDLNDAPCALVKVQFVGDILNVKGNVILPLLKEDYETWVYLTHGSRQMQVTAKNYLPLMIKFADYGVESVEKNRTYVLVLNQMGMSSNPADVSTTASTVSVSPVQVPAVPSNTISDDERLFLLNNRLYASRRLGQYQYIRLVFLHLTDTIVGEIHHNG